MARFSIDQDTGISYEDSGRWRSYQLYASGNDIDELMADAHIAEVDQNGDDINFYPLEESSNEIYKVSVKIIEEIGYLQKCNNCGREIDQNDCHDNCSEDCFKEAKADFLAEQKDDL